MIGDVRRGRRAFEQKPLFVVVGRADLHDGARQAEPRSAIVRRRGDDLAEQGHAGAEIVLAEGRVGILADLRERFRRRAGVGFDLRFQRHCAVSKLAVLECLFDGGVGGKRHKGRRNSKQRGECAGANKRPNHRKNSSRGRAISPGWARI